MKWVAIAAVLVLGLSGEARAGAAGEATAAPLVLAQSSLAVIVAPKRIDTDQETVDFTGRAMAPGEVTLTVNGIPVAVAPDGSFRIRQQVPVGRSRLLLVVEGSYGDKAEQKIFVRRTAAAAKATEYGRFHALVIGNNAYQNLKDLEMAVVDAEAVAELLEQRYGFEVEVLVDATRYDIISALSRLRAELTEDDNLLIYYAGHGSLDIGSDEGYWLPVDAEPDNPVNWISNNNISDQLRAMSAKHVMVVADSCYSGKLTRNVAASLKTGAERSAWLARMNGRRSRTALTSGGLEPVLDAGGGQYSVFAKAFLETLRDNTEVLDGQSLFDAIKRPIVVNADQTPEYADVRKAGHDGGDFIFVPLKIEVTVQVASVEPAPTTTGVPTTNVPQTSSNIAVEMAFWQSIQNSNSIADHEAYLERFPNGNFAILVHARLNALKSQVPATTPEPAPKTSSVDVEMIYWQSIQSSNSIADHEAYLQKFPNGSFAPLVRARLNDLTAAAAPPAQTQPAPSSIDVELIYWQSVKDSDSIAEHEAYLNKFPDGEFAPLVRARLKTLKAVPLAAIAPPPEPKPAAQPRAVDVEIVYWQSIRKSKSIAEHEAYLRKFPNGEFAPIVRARLDDLEATAAPKPALEPESKPQGIELAFWESVKNSQSPADYKAYLGQYPNGYFAGLARSRVAALQKREDDIVAATLKEKQEAERKAAELAMLRAVPQPAAEPVIVPAEPPPPVITEQALKQNAEFKKALSDYLEIQFGVEFDGIESLTIKRVSGQTLTVDLKYYFGDGDMSQRPARASMNVQQFGSSYKIIEFNSAFPSASQLRKLGRSEAGGSY